MPHRREASQYWKDYDWRVHKNHFPANEADAQFLETMLTNQDEGFVTRLKALDAVVKRSHQLIEAEKALSKLCQNKYVSHAKVRHISPRDGYEAYLKVCTPDELKAAASTHSVSYGSFMPTDDAERSELIEAILDERFPTEALIS